MIKGIGVDIVAVQRFTQWHTYPRTKLQRIFSDQEIAYCVQSLVSSAQRFAVRFAAKEALVKALGSMGISLPLLYVCRHASVLKDEGDKIPRLKMTDALKSVIPQGVYIHVSLSHTSDYAIAFVVISLE